MFNSITDEEKKTPGGGALCECQYSARRFYII